MKSSTEALPEANDAKLVKAYFEKVYPQMDFQRVYGSDMKKMVKWFEILAKNNIDIKLSEEGSEDMPAEQVAEKKTATASKSAPKTAAVKNAPAKKINTPRKMA
jgi:hypothetical protein